MLRPQTLALSTLGLVGAAALAVSAFAQGSGTSQAPALPGAVDPTRVTGGTYEADAAHTLVGWRVNHFGFNDYFGLFGDVTGTLTLDKANPARSRVDVTIPIVPVVASAGLREHLLRPGKDGGKPDFFGADPVAARFLSTSVTPMANNRATIVGNLTLNGVTRPVTLAARFTGAGANPMSKRETVGFEATATLTRSEFGLDTAIPYVSDRVQLDITAAFEKAAAEPQRPAARPADACNAAAVKPWTGKRATAAVRNEVARATRAASIRWLYPDSIVTQDYRVDRLNITMDKRTDIIRSAKCG